MAVLALKLCPDNLNLEHVLKLCLVHDLPEVIVGDLTPHDDRTTKAEDERKAMEQFAPEWLGLFDEYEEQSTDAVFVRSLTNSTWRLQARVYMERDRPRPRFAIESAKQNTGRP